MKIFNVEFAPLNVPLERRIQTLSTSIVLLLSLFGPIIGCVLTVFILLFGSKWLQILMLTYFIFIYFDRDSRFRCRSKWLTRCYRTLRMWRHCCNYFPIKLIKTADLDPSKDYIFCTFPHGILPCGAGFSFGTNGANSEKLFPGLEIRMLVLDILFYIPFFREYAVIGGGYSVSRKSIDYLLTTKPTKGDDEESTDQSRALVLFVGGASEGHNTKPGTYRIITRRRKGFVKIALRHGTSLVPVFSFGENEYYDQLAFPEGSIMRRLQDLVQKFTGFAPLVINGRGLFQYSFGITPRRSPVNVVVGSPLEIPKIENPTDAEVNQYHAKFIEKLVELFETYKSKYLENYENISLVLDD